jgi:YVTN family beta-propeller protein
MVAQYRAGRQTDALAAYQAGRQRLVSELGLEPGPELQDLQRRILAHDVELAAPTVVADEPASSPTSRRTLKKAGIATAVVVIGIAIGVAIGIGGTNASSSRVTTNEVVQVEAGSPGIRVDGTPAAMVAFDDSLWIADPSAQLVTRIDPGGDGVVDRIPVSSPGALAAGAGAVWAASISGDSIARIDPATGTVTQTIPLGGTRAVALAIRGGSLWVADTAGNSLVEISTDSGGVVRTVPLDISPSALTVEGATIWAADYEAGTVAQVDARTGRELATASVGNGPVSLGAETDAVWVANGLDSTVSKIDPATSAVTATISVGSGPSAVAVVGGSVWVASEYAQLVSRIDPATDTIVETRALGGGPTALSVSGGEVWAGVRPLTPHRGGTLKLLATRPISIDPALHGDLLPPVSDGLTRDGLVTFAQKAGVSGTRLVPDLAIAIPVPTDAGRTYTFRLRPNIVYSDGRPVFAADFRRELERVFNLRSYGAGLFTSLVGADECLGSRSPCRLSRGVVTDERTRIIAFHLRSADPSFLTNLTVAGLATPVPEGTPLQASPSEPIPGTGPYMVASASDKEIRYVRNPRFREWSHAAKPDGNPDQIVMRFDDRAGEIVRAIEAGHADWITEAVPAALLPDLSRRLAPQVHSNSAPLTLFYWLDTTVPPFDDVRVRRALNFALNREAIVRIKGGPTGATATCQVLPPGVRGYRPYCPYTRHPRTDGRWTTPDLQRARRLVAESGTAGADIAVWGPTDDPSIPTDMTRVVASSLRQLGYRTRLCLVPSDYSRVPRACDRHSIQLAWAGWGDPFAFSFFGQWMACHGAQNTTGFCDRRLDREMRRALTVEATDPRHAAVLWHRIDRAVTDRAVWLPLVNPRVIDFVSARVRNYQYHPYWGFLASQAWVD